VALRLDLAGTWQAYHQVYAPAGQAGGAFDVIGFFDADPQPTIVLPATPGASTPAREPVVATADRHEGGHQ
jgi:hypothetical protein